MGSTPRSLLVTTESLLLARDIKCHLFLPPKTLSSAVSPSLSACANGGPIGEALVQCSLEGFRVLSLNFGGKWKKLAESGHQGHQLLECMVQCCPALSIVIHCSILRALLCGAYKSPFVFVGWFQFLDIQFSFFVSTENKNITVCNVHTMFHRRREGVYLSQ